ncbi:Cytochrome c biogenesis protein CcsA [uncultured archaeon]|nr:Cytochrome c biogenesis protein CcsA [uncultured archaeon]
MRKNLLFIVTAALVLISIYLIFFVAPIPSTPAIVWGERSDYKIFYFHLPIAISTYVSFAIVFACSILYLRKKKQKWDIIGSSAAEIGVVFAFLTLVTGSIWGKSAWNGYWDPTDERLNTSLVLFLIYLAYLMVRQGVEEPEKRARLSAVFGIVGFISVPISFLSVRFYAKTHPCVVPPCPSGGGGGIGGDVLIFLLVNFAAFFLLTASLILMRIDNEKLKENINELKRARNL